MILSSMLHIIIGVFLIGYFASKCETHWWTYGVVTIVTCIFMVSAGYIGSIVEDWAEKENRKEDK